MILIVTNSSDQTADYLWDRLGPREKDWCRLDTDLAAQHIKVTYEDGVSYLCVDDRVVKPIDVTGLWYRRPRPVNINGVPSKWSKHSQAEWAEALEGVLVQIPFQRWVNHPTANSTASHKLEQLVRSRQLGLPVPKTLVTQSSAVLQKFWAENDGNIICKPLAYGYLDADEPLVIYTSPVSKEHLTTPLLAYCPTMFQERIDKVLDVRICIIDQTVIAVGLRCTDEQKIDIRRNNMSDVIHGSLDVPNDISAKLRTLLHSYKLRFGAIDMVIDRNGGWIFLELNPNGQWAWLDQIARTDITGAMIQALYSH